MSMASDIKRENWWDKKKEMKVIIIIIDMVHWLKGGKKSSDLQLASSKKGARKTNLKQDKSNLFYFETDSETEQNWSSRETHLNLDDSEV